ncbi:MAG TPA: hypothetical protein VFH73_25660, partial [Polyangia bacterium]|nr:hypothetical protein [Polyangia bacterium]
MNAKLNTNQVRPSVHARVALWVLASLWLACGNETTATMKCEIDPGAALPDFTHRLGCLGDFNALASAPLDATLPGARSVKVVLDQFDKDNLYFQDSAKYKIH